MYLYRIITFMAYPSIGDYPIAILAMGSQVITHGERRRYFVVRKVFYKEATPMYTIPNLCETVFESLDACKSKDKNIFLCGNELILDNEHSLKVWNNYTNPVTQNM